MTVALKPELIDKFRQMRHNIKNLGPWGASEAHVIFSQLSHVMLMEIVTALAVAWHPHAPEMVTYIYNAARIRGVLPQSYTKEEFCATVEREAMSSSGDTPEWLED